MNEWQQLYHIDHEQNLLSKTNLDAAHVSFLRLIVYKQRSLIDFDVLSFYKSN